MKETGLKKNLNKSTEEKKLLLEKDHQKLSISRQCELLEIPRSTAYYDPIVDSEDLFIMNRIDEIYTQSPFYGKRRISAALKRSGIQVGIKRSSSLMKRMGIVALYPKKNTSFPNKAHKIYPYLLKDVEIISVNQVWSTDITYIRLQQGFVYLVAIIDWFSRYVLSWRVSITMEKEFCIECAEEALTINIPWVFNSDQGAQFTCSDFVNVFLKKEVQVSMDGKGRFLDNILIERLWRSVKYEEVYLKDYSSPIEAQQALKQYFHFYNNDRPHQSLNYKTPADIYFQKSILNS